MKLTAVFQVFTRSFYTFSRQVFDRQNTYFWPAYYLDLAIIIFFSPRLVYVIYILRWRRERIARLSTFDPAIHFLSATDFSMVMLILDFGLFHIFCKVSLAAIKNVHAPNWTFWRQLTVDLQDKYYQCRLTKEELELVLKNKIKDLKLKYSLISTILLPNWALTLGARALVWAQLENVDQSRFEVASKLSELPHLLPAIKRRAVLVMLLIDQLLCLGQVIIGNNQFHYLKKLKFFILI